MITQQVSTAEVLKRQREFFASGATRSESWRRDVLGKLRQGIREYESEILRALKEDLGKSGTESYMTEIGMVLEELDYMEKHLHRLMKKKRAATPVAQFAASSYVIPEPYGNVLVMSPWNYPFLLSVDPVIAAVAAGNTVIVKPSAYSPAMSQVLQRLFESCVPLEAVCVIIGGRQVNADLLEHRFDYIFFTGGKEVGRLVMEKASRYLTPVTLELGGKSPCIVDETADIPLAARRIVFGKYLNLGQTCVAPDYILVQEQVKDKLVACLQEEIRKQYGKEPLENPDYGHIVNRRHYDRLCKMLQGETVLTAGGTVFLDGEELEEDVAAGLAGRRVLWEKDDREMPENRQRTVFRLETLQIAPLILAAVPESRCMQEEIFGPVLPILSYKEREEVIDFVESRPRPLALYLFSGDKAWQKEALSRIRFGGGCVNDTVIHLATSAMPFGGVGESGMGNYHGKYGFDTFTHYKSIVEKKTWMDLPIRYQPYEKWKDKMIRRFMG